MASPGPLSLEILEVLVSADHPLTVSEVLAKVNERREQPLAYTTVMTVLSRMDGRYTVQRKRNGRGYVYSATSSDPAAWVVDELLREHKGAVMHFLSQASDDTELGERLRRLLSAS